jgi:hypothetical protein
MWCNVMYDDRIYIFRMWLENNETHKKTRLILTSYVCVSKHRCDCKKARSEILNLRIFGLCCSLITIIITKNEIFLGYVLKWEKLNKIT